MVVHCDSRGCGVYDMLAFKRLVKVLAVLILGICLCVLLGMYGIMA